MTSTTDDANTSPEVMLQFYRMLYPFKSIFTWLNHEHVPTKLFTHREFAFTLQGDVYLRYHSFNTAEDLKKQVLALNPTRFEIGPVYSAKPRDKKTVRSAVFTPQKRELVFDIDMTDYDGVRTCCSGGDICSRCWGFISAAVKILHSALVDQFGFRHLLWVYSGRRGIHLWISDPEAMDLTDDQRRALVSALTVVEGGKEMAKKVNVRMSNNELPPSLWGALKTARALFNPLILEDQECFRTEEGWDALLQLIPDHKIVDKFRTEWSKDPDRSSAQKWDELGTYIMKEGDVSRLKCLLEDVVLQYTYPRLDAEVSKHRNHLLKAPFCVHPKTGRVCVPVDPANVEQFNPRGVPTATQLLRELDVAGEGADWEKTSLKPYVEMLDRHTMGLLEEVRRAKRAKYNATFRSPVWTCPLPTPLENTLSGLTSTSMSSSSPPAGPTATSSSTPSTNSPLNNTSTLLFGFLVTALSIFAIFMTMGILWNRLVARRRAIDAMLETIPANPLRFQRPVIWDASSTPNKHAPSWLDIKPVAAQIYIHSESSPAQKKRVIPFWRHHILDRLPPEISYLFYQPIPPSTVPSDIDVSQVKPSHGSDIRISLLVAMPHSPKSTEGKQENHIGSHELVFATTNVLYHDPGTS
ncbi:hypothetical protein JVU11DRAFT_5781 [Chiua virens]|nr:hypothetical protein JVU11DRAFT_5781 [Chiua virens]